MERISFFRIALVVSLSLPLASAIPVRAQLPQLPSSIPNKIKTKISKAKTTLGRAERALKDTGELFERADGDKRVNRPEELTRIEGYLEKSTGWIKDVEDELSGLPDIGEIGALRMRTETAKAQVEDFRGRLESGKKASLQENATLEEGMKKDKDAIDALIALAEELRHVRPDTPPERIAMLTPFERDAQRFVDTYGGLKTVLSDEARMMRITAQDLKTKLLAFRQGLAKFKEALPRYIADQLAEAERRAKEAETGNAFVSYYASPAPKNALLAAKNYRTVAPTISGADLELPDRTEKTLAALQASVDKAAEKAIAKNQPLPDTYAGADRDSLASAIRGFWKTERAAESVLGVRFFDKWDRRTAWNWNDFRSSWEKSDDSLMQAAVLVRAPDGKHAYQRYVRLRKDHLNGSRLLLSGGGGTGRPVSPFDIVPLGNIK